MTKLLLYHQAYIQIVSKSLQKLEDHRLFPLFHKQKQTKYYALFMNIYKYVINSSDLNIHLLVWGTQGRNQ